MPRLLVFCCVLSGLAAAVLLSAAIVLHRLQDSRQQHSEWAVGFSAEFSSHDSADASRNCVGRTYVNAVAGPRGVRQEMSCGGRKRIYIWKQQGLTVVLDPDTKAYWRPSRAAVLEIQESSFRACSGREKVNGRIADHCREQRKQADGSILASQVWDDPRLHTAVRVVTPTYNFNLTNVKEGAQPEALFAIPQDYREIAAPAESSPALPSPE